MESVKTPGKCYKKSLVGARPRRLQPCTLQWQRNEVDAGHRCLPAGEHPLWLSPLPLENWRRFTPLGQRQYRRHQRASLGGQDTRPPHPAAGCRQGWLALWLGLRVAPGNTTLLSLILLAVIAGHMYTPWLRFHGGKGVATALGAFLA